MTEIPEIPEIPYLLTPGPLTTSEATKRAMLRDWGSRDAAFIELNARVRRRLVEIAGVADSHVAVPVQGSGTFAVEAMLGSFVAPGAACLVLRVRAMQLGIQLPIFVANQDRLAKAKRYGVRLDRLRLVVLSHLLH